MFFPSCSHVANFAFIIEVATTDKIDASCAKTIEPPRFARALEYENSENIVFPLGNFKLIT